MRITTIAKLYCLRRFLMNYKMHYNMYALFFFFTNYFYPFVVQSSLSVYIVRAKLVNFATEFRKKKKKTNCRKIQQF